MKVDLQAFFLPVGHNGARGARFCVFHAPTVGPVRAAVLLVPPFAEELNKCRRMLSLQAQALAQAGCAVLVMDLEGCGDSGGEFGDTSWDAWLNDLQAGLDWLLVQAPVPWVLWGVRSGCLLAREGLLRWHDRSTGPGPDPAGLVFWQPSVEGRQVLQQFLRLKVYGEALAGSATGVMDTLKADLAAGHSVTVAGYVLPAALAQGLGAAQLLPTLARPCPSQWIEVSTKEGATPLPATARAAKAWAEAGQQVQLQVVPGPAFWHSTEIEVAPALLAATTQAVLDLVRAPG